MAGRIEEMETTMQAASSLIKRLLQCQDNMEAKRAAHAEITFGFTTFPKRQKVTTLEVS